MSILYKDPQSTLFTREEMESAHTSVIRLRERLRALAKISALNLASERASRMTSEATAVLNAIGCVIHNNQSEAAETKFFIHLQNEVDPNSVRGLAIELKARVLSSGSSVIIQNLRQQYPREDWLLKHDVHSYIGVPVFAADRSISAVAGVFGGRNRGFGDEDDCWLRTAGQLVSDSVAYETLAGKMHDIERLKGNLATEATRADGPEARKPTILVIDDDLAINDLICELLEMDGYQVESAFNGVEAIQAFQPAKHDLVITDIAMPLMNGWELIAALRVRSPALPIILISGYQTGEWNQSYLAKQGVSAVLNKPLDLGGLTSLVSKLIPL
jgi:CheY-like chemotaxis protein